MSHDTTIHTHLPKAITITTTTREEITDRTMRKKSCITCKSRKDIHGKGGWQITLACAFLPCPHNFLKSHAWCIGTGYLWAVRECVNFYLSRDWDKSTMRQGGRQPRKGINRLIICSLSFCFSFPFQPPLPDGDCDSRSGSCFIYYARA